MAHKMRLLALACLLLSLPLLLAMGIGGGEGPTSIPEPRSNYLVVLTDVQGTQVTLKEFSIEGQDFVLGRLGQGELAVPLNKVRLVELRKVQGKLSASLTLTDGKRVQMEVKPQLLATGKTDYGNFRIRLEEVGRIEVKGPVK
ncbi:MAG: hypothetical protein C4525_09810 [Desulfarculus sp.]|nr:MAG: hypothetical protein C4525_09810 [Desulfarculus sp.]